jgi:hypothetical protein
MLQSTIRDEEKKGAMRKKHQENSRKSIACVVLGA